MYRLSKYLYHGDSPDILHRLVVHFLLSVLIALHEIHGFFAHHCHLAGKACKHQNDQRKANAPVHSQHQHKAGNRRDLSAHQIRQLMGKVSLHLGAVFINDFS